MNNENKVVLAAVIGLVAGGVIGILLAPEKGSELRRRMATKAKEISDDVIEDAREGFTTLKEKFGKRPDVGGQEA
jgi:gas vesicle protein